mmetsp:Transcript_2600/g.6582  ORF Transcript_2600/g.6582 Transcript_2600/m.6582 type:complete len:267 (+) Transcript_2600:104-904(+)
MRRMELVCRHLRSPSRPSALAIPNAIERTAELRVGEQRDNPRCITSGALQPLRFPVGTEDACHWARKLCNRPPGPVGYGPHGEQCAQLQQRRGGRRHRVCGLHSRRVMLRIKQAADGGAAARGAVEEPAEEEVRLGADLDEVAGQEGEGRRRQRLDAVAPADLPGVRGHGGVGMPGGAPRDAPRHGHRLALQDLLLRVGRGRARNVPKALLPPRHHLRRRGLRAHGQVPQGGLQRGLGHQPGPPHLAPRPPLPEAAREGARLRVHR